MTIEPYEPPLGEDSEPWLKRETESIEDYEKFRTYRDLGPGRSLSQVALMMEHPRYRLRKLCAEQDWNDRCRAFDAEKRREFDVKMQSGANAMRERHVELSEKIQSIIGDRLENFDPEDLGPMEIAKWLEISAKLERAARGVPDSITTVQVTGKDGGPIELTTEQMTPKERQQLLSMAQAEIAKRLGNIENRLGTGNPEEIVDAEVVEDPTTEENE